MMMQINRMNCWNSLRANQQPSPFIGEGSTTRAKARSAKRREASGPFMGEDIVCSAWKHAAAVKGEYDIANHTERKAIMMYSRRVLTSSMARPSITTSLPSGLEDSQIKRQCNICKEIKFAPDLVGSKRYLHGYMPLCKSCRNEYWRLRRSKNPEYRKRQDDYVRRSRLLTSYGMTQADYEAMFKKQDGKCKLCKSTSHGRVKRFRYWNIDHDHKTGKVRGLLCHLCNITIGKYEALAAKIGENTIMKYLKE